MWKEIFNALDLAVYEHKFKKVLLYKLSISTKK